MSAFRLTVAMAVLICAAFVAAAPVDVLAPAASVTVTRNGQTTPAKSAKEAAAAAQAGDVIMLGAGTHQGPLVVGTSNVTITGEPGARINANAEWKPTWKREPGYGLFAYSSPIPFAPVTIAIDQRVMIDAKESRGGLAVHQIGSGRNGRSPLQGVFTYLAKSKQVIVSFATDLDPSQHLIEATPLNASAVIISKVDKVTVKNLILTGGVAGVYLSDTDGSVVDHCLIYGVDAGIRLTTGAKNCKILANDITWNADALNADTAPETADVGNDAWHAHKKYGTYDKFGIAVDQAGENNEIAGNYIYDVWNGITTGSGTSKGEMEAYYKDYVEKGISRYNRGLNVHHNRLDLTLDDALEPDGEVADNQWHGNVVTRARCAARIKTITIGPLFFYNNTMLDCLDGLRLYKSWPEQATVYAFNNVIKFKTAVIYHDMSTVAWDDPWLKAHLAKGTPGFRLYNNVFIAEQAFANNSSDGKSVKPNFKGDNNVYTCPADNETNAAGIDLHGVFNANPKFIDPAAGDYRLSPGSPGLGAGGDLAKLLPDVKLPAWSAEPGLIDADKDRAPRGPTSGLWAVAAEPCKLGERDMRKFTVVPVRWVGGPDAEFVIDQLPAEGELAVNFVRAFPTGSGPFKVVVTDEKDAVLFKHDGKPTENDGVEAKFALAGAKQLRVKIEDSDKAVWRVEPASGRVGVNAAKPVSLRKYDGVPASMTYTLAKDGTFDVTFKSKYGGTYVEVTLPDGSTKKFTATEKITGPAGDYRFAVQTGKAADISISGPEPVLYFVPEKPIQLKSFWGKPAF